MINHELYKIYDRDLTKRLEQRLLKQPIKENYSDNSISVLKKRYFIKDENGVSQEGAKEMLARVAANISYPDVFYKENDGFKIAKTFYEMMINQEFMPNSPTLMNAGREMQQLSACFVIPIEDSMESIFNGVRDTAMIHKTGGGTGFSFSDVRRKNHFVATTYGKASGPVSFIRAYDEATNSVNQGGFRRGANMGILRVDHPDIIEFIHAKEEEKEKRYINFNFSVAITNEFMNAVEKGQYYYPKNPVKGKLNYLTTKDIENDKNSVKEKLLPSEKELNILIKGDKVIAQYPTKRDIRDIVLEVGQLEIGKVDKKGRIMFDAKKVFYEIAKLAWKNGEPGVIFLDNINRDNPTPNLGEIKSTNPCGEQPLLPYEACNLGHVNLSLMIKEENGKRCVDYKKLEKTVKNAVHFLDNVIDMSRFPLEAIIEMVHGNRKIGLGVMGFADMLFKLCIPYDSEDGLRIAEDIMKFINEKGKEKSRELAERRGTFPNFKGSIYDNGNLEDRLRNATITTIAPTGTTSIISDCSSGIEPLFNIDFIHRDADNQIRRFKNKEFILILEKEGIDQNKILTELKEKKSLQDIKEVPEYIRKIFVTANDISPDWHIKMQVAFQKYTHNAVSKTINMPNNATVDDVENALLFAYKLGCKGLTVYRDASREEQVLSSLKEKPKRPKLPEWIKVDDEGYLIPRPRPKSVSGETIKEETGCGNLFVTVNKNKGDNRLFEAFANLGKAGGCPQAGTEAVGRLSSLALRVGVNPRAITGQLSKISCPKPCGLGPNGIASCYDGISKAIMEVCGIKPLETQTPYDSDNFEPIPTKNDNEEDNKLTLANLLASGACPQCGSPMQYKEGCMGGICIDQTCAFSTCS